MNSPRTLRFARNTLAGSALVLLGLICCSPSGGHPYVDIEGTAATSGKGGNTGSGGSSGSGNAKSSGGAQSTGGTSGGSGGDLPGSGGSGNTGNTGSGGVGNTGTGGTGNTGNTGGVGNTGNTGNTGGTSGSGNTGNTGGSGNTGNTGGSGNTGNTGGSGNTGNTGGSGNVEPPPDIQNGMNAWASRYWDCCKPACGWTGNTGGRTPITSCDINNNRMEGNYGATNSCENGPAFMCWSGAPWSVGDRLSYGFAAASGPNYVCGRCFHLQFTGTGHHGNNAGAVALNGKHMIVQVINNGGVEQDQFDLLIPGGGVGALNGCSRQWNTSDLGAQYGGFMTGCNGDTTCVRQKCQQVFAGKPELMAGCDWFLGWFSAADNPNVRVERIACPAAITQRSGLSDPG